VTIDVAAIGSPTWVFGRVNKGDVLQYASPQYRHYASTFERGMGKDGFFAFNGAYLFVPCGTASAPPSTASRGRMSSARCLRPHEHWGRDEVVTYLDTYSGLRKVLEAEYFKKIAETKPPFLLRSEQIAGAWSQARPDGIHRHATRAYQYNQKGAKLKFMLPEEVWCCCRRACSS